MLEEKLVKELILLKYRLNLSLRKYRWRYLKCFVFMMVYTITSVIFPGLISIIIDKGIMVRDYHYTLKYICGFFSVGIVMVLSQHIERMSFFKLSQDILYYIKVVVFRKIMNTNILFWSNHNIGDVMTVIESDISKIEALLTTEICDAIVNLFVVLGMSFFLIYLKVEIGILLIGVAVLFVIIQRQVGNKLKINMKILREAMGNTTALINEILNHIQHIQIIGLVIPFLKKYKKSNETVKNIHIKHMHIASISMGVSNLYVIISMLIVLSIGSFYFFRGLLTIGTLLTLVLYAQRLYTPINGLCNTYTMIKNITPSITKILDILESEDTIRCGTFFPQKNILGDLEFRNVTFRYSKNSKNVLENYCLHIKPGEKVGIVGKNGSGKTTIIKLLAGLCVPESGHIVLDGVSLEKYDFEFLRSQIGYVLQRDYLGSGKLKDILKFGVEDAYIDIKNELIQEIGLDIDKFSNGWDTYIDENSNNISGGEMQKLSLIRAFSSSKAVYIMDEPTSFMDIESEKKVCGILNKLLCDKTSIIITHRPQILKICDRVVVLGDLDNNIKELPV